MSDIELRDELMTLLTAGHETTATGLSWAFERLLRTPRVLELPPRSTTTTTGRRREGGAARAAGDRGRGPQAHPRHRGGRLAASPALGAAGDRGAPRPPRPVRSAEEFRPSASAGGAPSRTPGSRSAAGVRCIGASFAQVEMRTGAARGPAAGAPARAVAAAGARRDPARDRGARSRLPRGRRRAASRRAAGGTRRRPQRSPRRRGRAQRGRRPRSRLTGPRVVVRLDQRGDVVVGRVRAAARRSARSRARRLEVERLAVETTVTGSPLRSANALSSSTSSRIAPGRSRHQPVGREPITFMPSTIQRVTRLSGAASRRRRSLPRAAAPPSAAHERHAHALVLGGVADRREQIDARRTRRWSRGRCPYPPAAPYPRLVSVAVTDRPVLAGVLGALVIAFSGILVRLAECRPPRRPSSLRVRAARARAARLARGAPLRERRRASGCRSGRGSRVRRRPHVLAPLDRGGGRRAGHGARQRPGRLRGAACLGCARRAARQPRAGRDPGRVRRRGPDLRRDRQGRVRRRPLMGVIGLLTAITYALFILILRQGNVDERRPAGPLFDATLSAAVFSASAESRSATSTGCPASSRRRGSCCLRSPRRCSAGC